ncbi:hypothetical protein H3Z28_002310 [Salmonella enterica subsp. enterica serovar Ank]|nr:hypothetical protein [Salmonella enterica subsp. enterica serovar Ank]
MVIKVNSKGEAKLFKYEAERISIDNDFRKLWKKEFREARQNGWRYYKRIYIFTGYEPAPWAFSEHEKYHDKIYDSRIQPPETYPDCRCCWVEWLIPDWNDDEIENYLKSL